MKSAVIAALLLAFLASANGLTVRTTIITTTAKEEENPAGQESTGQCNDQVQEAMQVRECMTYISEAITSPYGHGLALRMVVNPGEQMLQQCCKKLANVAEECRCKAIEEMVRVMEQQVGQGHQQSEKKLKMMMRIKNLPKMCNMEPQAC